jgi:hypothetical protein
MRFFFMKIFSRKDLGSHESLGVAGHQSPSRLIGNLVFFFILISGKQPMTKEQTAPSLFLA